MAASLTTPPPSLAYNGDPIYIQLETDQIGDDFPKITITLSGSGPLNTETLEITWGGSTYTFTFKTTPVTAFDLPVIGAGTLITVADAIAEAFRNCEVISEEWDVTRATGGVPEYVYLTYRQKQFISLAASEAATNTTIAIVDVSDPGPALVDNLSALVQAWKDTGDTDTDEPLLKQHATYDVATKTATIDLAPAFSFLEPFLPDRGTIADATPAFVPEETEGNYLKYFFRYADKYGTPPGADKMLKSSSYLAVLGGRAFDSLTPITVSRILHNYARRDGETFRKPVAMNQPDWTYWLSNSALQHRVNVLIYWSDGTTSVYLPFPGTTFTPVADKCYCMPSGYMQLKINEAPQEVGTDADAIIVGYDFRLERTGALGTFTITVRYDVDPFGEDWGLFLLMSNGMGGCESVRLKGKKARKYETSSESFAKSKWYNPEHDEFLNQQEGTIAPLQSTGRPGYEVSTGWYDNPFYLDHLQQLPLTNCWLIDMEAQRFLPVIVEGKEQVITQDDETLYAFDFTIRAGWTDKNWNV